LGGGAATGQLTGLTSLSAAQLVLSRVLSVAFVFRVHGTRHGQLWSSRGIKYFVLVAALSLGLKYVLRVNGRHIFNPSNLGLTAGLLLIGPSHSFSEHLWWAPFGAPALVSMAVIVGGGWWVLRLEVGLPALTLPRQGPRGECRTE
jgi:hypothetical protein